MRAKKIKSLDFVQKWSFKAFKILFRTVGFIVGLALGLNHQYAASILMYMLFEVISEIFNWADQKNFPG